jgi:uncharacterized repeat protein (TIGR01451 family)
MFLFVAAISLPALAVSSRQSRSLTIAAQSTAAATTFAADCVTPKSTFNLGETVCVQVSGAQGMRLQWVDADGYSVAAVAITSDPQTASFTLPTTDQSLVSGVFTANNLGKWRANVVTLRNSVLFSVFFVVRDPANAKVDLSIVKSIVGGETPVAGQSFQYQIRVTNNGPDDAVNAHLVDNTYTNSSFVGLTQTGGPSFTCTAADCRIASFASGAEATFVLDFTASAGGGTVTNSASISSSTAELNPRDNTSGSASATLDTGGGTPPTCNIVVTAPPAVTLFTGPGATECGVTFLDADTTLGTPSATSSCPGGEDIARTPADNSLPVGTTIVTYSATDTEGNTASATQAVTVIDNTPPVLACPANMTLEATCPSGAIGTWTAPVATDNCAGAVTTQTSGPASGSVFAVGSTTVGYSATDAAGNHASCAFTVTVLSATATLQNVAASVDASSLSGTQKQGLLPKLDAALSSLSRGSTDSACNQIAAFINLVKDYVSRGEVTAAEGQAWITSATHASDAAGCSNHPCS